MARTFDIPEFYRSPIVRTVKNSQKILDPKKKNLEPSLLDFGPVQVYIPRHFGFCYGVENAIDIAYRTVEENPDRDVYLLSEMIHNQAVNNDLRERGVQFLFETDGTERIPIDSLTEDDIVIVPAFGTTVEIQEKLREKNIDPTQYDTTCPFVEKVWRRGNQLSEKGYALVIHGKHTHEETRATFSQTAQHSPAVVVLNPDEAHILAEILQEERPLSDFEKHFGHKSTDGFNPLEDLEYFGVINQTTMLANETKKVMNILKEAAKNRYGEANIEEHFADTSDTLCYATNENQSATYALAEKDLDMTLVVGGYNSSNTMHIVEILEHDFPTYHVKSAEEILSETVIKHFNQWEKKIEETQNWIPDYEKPLTVGVTSGASCPDVLVDDVILKLVNMFENTRNVEEVLEPYQDEEELEKAKAAT